MSRTSLDDEPPAPQRWQLASRRPIPATVRGVSATEAGGALVEWTSCSIMGVVNTTPDSFSDGGMFGSSDDAVAYARQLVREGAFVVDIGGESTRPGADEVPLDEELRRTIPVIEQIAGDANVLISVDTRKPAVAEAAVSAGAHIVNDVGGLRDPRMIGVCASLGVPAVVMHMQGTPADMQRDPRYDDVVAEVRAWLIHQADVALAEGVPAVMVDPGIGFGKTLEHNLALLSALPLTKAHPVLVGVSRKRTIQQLAHLDAGANRDAGSIAAHLVAAQRGVAMVRVHDVAGHAQAFAVDESLRAAAQRVQ
jgi:dihydropteroate synthase